MKINDFKKGSGVFLYGTTIIILAVLIILVCIEQSIAYDNASKTQRAADAISDATALYMLNSEDATAQDANKYAEDLGELFSDQTGITISDVYIDQNKINNNYVAVDITAQYSPISGIANDYKVTRSSATSFARDEHLDASFQWFTTSSLNCLVSGFFKNADGINNTYIEVTNPNVVSSDVPVYAAESGEIVSINTNEGNSFIKICHGTDYNDNVVVTQYSCMTKVEARLFVGKKVNKGDVIGYVRIGVPEQGEENEPETEGENVIAVQFTGLRFSVYYANPNSYSPVTFLNPLLYCYGLSEASVDEDWNLIECNISNPLGELTELTVADDTHAEDYVVRYSYTSGGGYR